MRKSVLIASLVVMFALPVFASHSKQVERVEESGIVMSEILNIPEGSIPQDLLRKAECIAVIPAMKKAALGIGGNYGKGVMLCRSHETWTAPVMVQITGGSFGFQIGGTSTDLILLVMNKRGINKLLESKVTLGGNASAAAGPKGRSTAAMTDVQMRAEILSYARSRGLFAGISLEGCVLKPNMDDTEDLYGKRVDPRELLLEGKGEVPESAKSLIKLLGQYPSVDQIDPSQQSKPAEQQESGE